MSVRSQYKHKQEESAEIEKQTQEFLRKGGEIKKVKIQTKRELLNRIKKPAEATSIT